MLACWCAPGVQARQPASNAADSRGADDAGRAPGATEIWFDRASGVTSAWLSNGVLVHHRKVAREAAPPDPEPGRRGGAGARPALVVSVTIAGAELLETPENRGVSDAAVASAWNARSVRSREAAQIREELEAGSSSVRGFAGGDSFVLTGTTTSDSLEPALGVIRLYLTEPRVNPDELTRWRERSIEVLEERRRQGNDALEQVIGGMFGPQEARARRASREAIEAISHEQAQVWLDAALGIGEGAAPMPMEVAFSGDLDAAEAIALAETYFSSLPARPRITRETLAEHRTATRAERPPELMTLPTWKGTPLVLIGFFGADLRDLGDHRALAAAARILDERLEQRLPPDQLEDDQSFAMATPGSVYPGFGLFLAATRAKEGSDVAAAENIHKLLDDLMTGGPSAEELGKASQELADVATKALGDPMYWARALARSTYHGMPLAELARAPGAYRDMSPTTIQEALRRYWTPERSIKLIVRPAPEAAAPSPEPAPSER